jgi:predicted N-acetyltransferase YhbS
MEISIRLLQEDELEAADRIFRLAFGTFIGLPEPTEFCGDADYIFSRWKSDPRAAFVAEVDGRLVGSNLATNWGSVSFFGPLSVHPEFWGQGIAQRLIAAAIDRFDGWGTQQAGLFTFPNSPKHHALYQKFGFYPRFLTFIMAKSILEIGQELPTIAPTVDSALLGSAMRYSQLNLEDRSLCLEMCAELTDSIYPGLDVTREIMAVQTQNLGDTVLLWDDSNLVGFAVCHCGQGSEAGSDVCYVKFGAVRSGKQAGEQFERLLDRCETFAASQKMSRLLAGVNTSHEEAYQRMVDRHFRTEITGVVMHKPNEPGYNRSDVFVLDNWR